MNLKTAVFISGRGSNLKSFLDNISDSSEAGMTYIFSNKKKAPGLMWALKRGCTFETNALKEPQDWILLAKKLNTLKIKTLYLLGFMKIIPELFLNEFKGKAVNLHPSLLPDFPGLNSIEKSLDEKRSVGVTLHKVTKDMDDGPIRFQKKIILNSKHSNELEQLRIHEFEQAAVQTLLRLESDT